MNQGRIQGADAHEIDPDDPVLPVEHDDPKGLSVEVRDERRHQPGYVAGLAGLPERSCSLLDVQESWSNEVAALRHAFATHPILSAKLQLRTLAPPIPKACLTV